MDEIEQKLIPHDKQFYRYSTLNEQFVYKNKKKDHKIQSYFPVQSQGQEPTVIENFNEDPNSYILSQYNIVNKNQLNDENQQFDSIQENQLYKQKDYDQNCMGYTYTNQNHLMNKKEVQFNDQNKKIEQNKRKEQQTTGIVQCSNSYINANSPIDHELNIIDNESFFKINDFDKFNNWKYYFPLQNLNEVLRQFLRIQKMQTQLMRNSNMSRSIKNLKLLDISKAKKNKSFIASIYNDSFEIQSLRNKSKFKKYSKQTVKTSQFSPLNLIKNQNNQKKIEEQIISHKTDHKDQFQSEKIQNPQNRWKKKINKKISL
ncbi:hypothetical protein PPERSA_09824 [Pseudocohnilembus persalinus]|uniref:Uncharacterized protein n=1 Tax=Pseudocohnilembus persalinus TaxID=266149 RepID=A0A0V0QTW0_PSEPJ|nr:hypothetical protein PPERSA_09824 [Pseudocohnilembus persalinus]|eukprot:KRX05684.1 hypothetical protein PPERSA_09824 [Pseudocohnilembus persalinus]